MPLYQPENPPPINPRAAAHAVHNFLTRCRAWALEREIPKYRELVEQTNDPAEAAKLHEWITYLRFTEHAIAELERGELDHWFTRSDGA
jgi:hypothetical protein